MSKATLSIKLTQRRLMKLSEAAYYCGLSQRRFAAACDVSPIVLADGTRLWDVNELDTWIDGLKQAAADDDAIVSRLS